MSKTAIILLNFNSTDETIDCLESLQVIADQHKDLLLVVVDNHSSEQEVEKLDKYMANNQSDGTHYIKNNKNLGFSGGNNVGIQYALSKEVEYLLILNNDTIVKDDFLSPMIYEMENDKSVSIVVPKIYFAPGHEFHKNRYRVKEQGKVIWYAGGTIDWANVIGHHVGVDEIDSENKYASTQLTDYATGACMLIRASVIRKVGMFDKDYFLYYEDSDLSMRVQKAGYSIKFVPSATIWHKNAGSTGGSGSQLQDYYITRNRLLFGFKYAPIRAKIALLKEAGKQLFSGRKWQKKGIQDFFMHRLGKGSYPVAE